MRANDTALLTRIKTRELARQHDALARHLDRLRLESAAVASPHERFELLRRGLAAAPGGASGLLAEHASYAEGLAEEIACGTASQAAIDAGVARLERELACGARRAATALLYGHLFDEEAPPGDDPRERAARKAAEAALRAGWQSAPSLDASANVSPDASALRAFFDECMPATAGSALVPSVFADPVRAAEVRAHLGVLGRSFDHRPDLRRYARQLSSDARAVAELSGALTILLRDLDSWRWDAWPTPVNVRWNRSRYRAFLEFDLVPLLVLEALALRLGVWARASWLPRADAPLAPEGDRRPLDTLRATLRSRLVLPDVPYTIGGFRQGAEHAYAGAGSITGQPDAFQSLFAQLNAELWLHAESRPGEPTFVAQTDVANFFPSLPHATLEALLAAMRVPPDVAAFVARYLRGPFTFEGSPFEPRRGLFPGHSLARVLADSLLLALDAHVARRSGLPTLRFMDDIYWVSAAPAPLAAAWGAAHDFCARTGLALNLAKSAACRLEPRNPALASTPLPSELPLGAPARRLRWSFLELDERGEWGPAHDAVEEFAASLRARLEAPATLRETVREYVSAMGYFVRGLAPLAPLGPAHAERLRAPLGRVHGSLFGPGRGIVGLLRERIAARWPALAGLAEALPESWFSWPLTAGGLGLYNPATFLVGAARALAAWQTPRTPAPLTIREGGRPEAFLEVAWVGVYQFRATPLLRVAPPDPSPAMEGRQRDFIARGGEVQGGTQKGLHAYWQWLLETHGPAMLDFFGTFRFLPTEVVPVQQIDASPAALVDQSSDDDIPF